MKKIISGMLTGALALSLGVMVSAEENGILRMATNAVFPPYEFYDIVDDQEQIVGIDVEIAGLIAEELGMTLQIEDMAFDSILAAVQTGNTDIAMAAITTAEDYMHVVCFTEPYFTDAPRILVSEDSDIAGPSGLDGKIIGVKIDTIADVYIGIVKDAEIERFETGTEAVQELLAGGLEAVVIDEGPANMFAEQNEGLKLLDIPFIEQEYVIAVAEDNEELREKINTVLHKLNEDGVIQEIVDKYVSDEGHS